MMMMMMMMMKIMMIEYEDDDDSYMITFFLQDRSITKRSLPTNSLNRFNLL